MSEPITDEEAERWKAEAESVSTFKDCTCHGCLARRRIIRLLAERRRLREENEHLRGALHEARAILAGYENDRACAWLEKYGDDHARTEHLRSRLAKQERYYAGDVHPLLVMAERMLAEAERLLMLDPRRRPIDSVDWPRERAKQILDWLELGLE